LFLLVNQTGESPSFENPRGPQPQGQIMVFADLTGKLLQCRSRPAVGLGSGDAESRHAANRRRVRFRLEPFQHLVEGHGRWLSVAGVSQAAPETRPGSG